MKPLLWARLIIVAAVSRTAVAEVLFCTVQPEKVVGQNVLKGCVTNIGDVAAEFVATWTTPNDQSFTESIGVLPGRIEIMPPVEIGYGRFKWTIIPGEYFYHSASSTLFLNAPMPGLWRFEAEGICTDPNTPLSCWAWQGLMWNR